MSTRNIRGATGSLAEPGLEGVGKRVSGSWPGGWRSTVGEVLARTAQRLGWVALAITGLVT